MTWVSFEETGVVGDGFHRVLGTSAGAITGSGAQMALAVVMGSYGRAAGVDGCHATTCGLMETSEVTPHGPQHATIGGRNGSARTWSHLQRRHGRLIYDLGTWD